MRRMTAKANRANGASGLLRDRANLQVVALMVVLRMHNRHRVAAPGHSQHGTAAIVRAELIAVQRGRRHHQL